MKKIIIGLIALTLSINVSAREPTTSEVLMAIAKVESNCKDIVGDSHLKNKAYGMFQMRQPAVDEVNRIYGNMGINKAEQLRGNNIMQFIYSKLYLEHLIKEFSGNRKKAIMAYNLGPTNVRNGKTNNYYYNKVMKELKED